MTERIPIIIDTDPGVDDAIAIMLAAASDNLEIVGLTPVDGNVEAKYTFKNALDLSEFLQLGCPVAKGAERQLTVQAPRHSGLTHGATGMGSVTLPEAKGDYHPLPAWDFIYEKAKEYGGRLHIVAIGPLTNLARLLLEHPDAKDYIKEIDIMGGGVEGGNSTPYAEFNFWIDPPAADIVFKSGIPIVMAGLNVTEKTGIAFEFIDRLAEKKSLISGIIKALVNSYSDKLDNKEGKRSSIIHDAIPVFWLAERDACESRPCRIEICTVEGDPHWGESVASYDDEGSFNTVLITDIDMRRYEAWYEKMTEYFAHLS